jgi:hypothetical protein
LIEVDQSIGAHQAFAVGVGADLNAGAATACADLESCTMIREWIGPFFIEKRDRDQEFLGGGAIGAKICVVRIPNPVQIDLIPVMVRGIARIALIVILNEVTEGIDRLCKVPAKDLGAILWIGNDGRVIRRNVSIVLRQSFRPITTNRDR